MRTQLDAVAAYEGMTNVFKLKGTDVCEVAASRVLPLRCPGSRRRDVEIGGSRSSRQLADVDDMDEFSETALHACRELLGTRTCSSC